MRRQVVGKVYCEQCDRFFGIATSDGEVCAEPDCHEPDYTLDERQPPKAFAICPGRKLWEQLRDKVTVRSSGNAAVSRLPGVNASDNPSLENMIRGLEEGYGDS